MYKCDLEADLEAANSGQFDAGNHFSRNGTSWWTRLTSSSCLQESVSEKARRESLGVTKSMVKATMLTVFLIL